MSQTHPTDSKNSVVYISLGNWTNGWKGAGRLNKTRKAMKEFGVENLATYFVVSGNYDIVSINKAANLRSIVSCRLAMRMAGNIETKLFAAETVMDSGAKLNPKKVTVVSLGRWTDAGLKESNSRLTPEYIKKVIKKEKEMGVQLNSVYRVLSGGDYDVISVSQADNLAALGPSKDALSALGNIRTENICVISEEEYIQCQQKLT